MRNNFYVYEWFNMNTNEVFYVGKGTKNRYKNSQQRNAYFKNYYNKYKCDVRIVKSSLTEDEAFEMEKDLIEKYREIGQAQCNLTDGGEGCSFPLGSWNDRFRKLQYLNMWGKFSIMTNEEDYNPENLKEKSLEELYQLYKNYRSEIENILWFNSLGIYDENGDLNIGWECFED